MTFMEQRELNNRIASLMMTPKNKISETEMRR